MKLFILIFILFILFICFVLFSIFRLKNFNDIKKIGEFTIYSGKDYFLNKVNEYSLVSGRLINFYLIEDKDLMGYAVVTTTKKYKLYTLVEFIVDGATFQCTNSPFYLLSTQSYELANDWLIKLNKNPIVDVYYSDLNPNDNFAIFNKCFSW